MLNQSSQIIYTKILQLLTIPHILKHFNTKIQKKVIIHYPHRTVIRIKMLKIITNFLNNSQNNNILNFYHRSCIQNHVKQKISQLPMEK